jgi:hypothetical protein
MKSYKQYLAESKKVYEFKIKVAGEVPKDFVKHVKMALDQYKVESCSAGKSTPIQETQSGFPSLKNVELTVFEVTTSYPANSLQIASAISECSGVPTSHMIVRTVGEELEDEINNGPEAEGALLGTDYPTENNQDKVGEKRLMSFLKDLSSNQTTGMAYTGVNDALLAKSVPVEKTAKAKQTKETGTVSAIGSKAIKLPDPYKGR